MTVSGPRVAAAVPLTELAMSSARSSLDRQARRDSTEPSVLGGFDADRRQAFRTTTTGAARLCAISWDSLLGGLARPYPRAAPMLLRNLERPRRGSWDVHEHLADGTAFDRLVCVHNVA